MTARQAPCCYQCGKVPDAPSGLRLFTQYQGDSVSYTTHLCRDHWLVPTEVYADGGVCGQNGGPNAAIAGTWAYCWVLDGRRVYEQSGVVTTADYPGLTRVTNNITELVAVIRALKSLPRGWKGKLHTDSECTIKRLTGTGVINAVPDCLLREAYNIRAKLPQVMSVEWVLLDGHPTEEELSSGIGSRGHPVSEFNVWCDSECNRQRVIRETSRQTAAQNAGKHRAPTH